MNAPKTTSFAAGLLLFLATPTLLAWGRCSNLAISIASLNYEPGPRFDPRLEPKQFFWGEALQVSVHTSAAFQNILWTFNGAAIHDFDERIRDADFAAPGWSVRRAHSPIASHLSFRLYLLPSSKSGAPEEREIRLQATPAGKATPCLVRRTLRLNPHPRPAELYTADHRDPFQSNPHHGRVIEAHFQWHFLHGLNPPSHLRPHPSFLHWHHILLDRFNQWRALFGYPELKSLWPSPFPTTPGDEQRLLFTKDPLQPDDPNERVLPPPSHPTTVNSREEFEKWEQIVLETHNKIHFRTQSCSGIPMKFGCFAGNSSPKAELFWSFHLYIDKLYTSLCPDTGHRPPACPSSGFH